MWETLTESMEAMVGHYQALKALGLEKEKRLVAADVPVIEQLTKEEEKLIAAISEQEAVRQRSLAAILPVCSLANEQPTLAELLAVADEPYRPRLHKANETLLQLAADLQASSDRNTRLIRQALSIVDYNLNLLTQPAEAPAYTAGGQSPERGQAPRALFDRKA